MSSVGIKIEIIEYSPPNFNFDNYSFIFTSEFRDFEKDISFLNKNSIYQKMPFPKKNVRYAIKATKSNSLIGISDYIIPSTLFSKKETSFDKVCVITMTDSLRRLIFGNTSSSNSIKIHVQSTINYYEKGEKGDKGEKSVKSNSMNLSIKKEEKRSSTPKKLDNESKKVKLSGNSNSNLKIHKEEKKEMNKKLIEEFKKRSNSKPNLSNSMNMKIKSHQQIFQKSKEKEQSINIKEEKKEKIENKEKIEKKDKIIGKKDKIEIIEDPNDNSIIDEDLKREFPNNNKEIEKFFEDFEKKYPLNKLEQISEVNEMINYTKKVFSELLDYQINCYNSIKDCMEMNKKFNDLLVKYNDKYRLALKKLHKIVQDRNKYDLKNEITTNIQRNDFQNMQKILPLKKAEFDLYKDIFPVNQEKVEQKKYTEEQLKQIEEKKSKDENTKALLIRVIKNIYEKFGPLDKVLNSTNSNENEINNIINLSKKYNLPLNEKKIELEYVQSQKVDETDKKLEKYLKEFYSRKKVPKIILKKISNNDYEYGTIKINVKIDGDSIKVNSGNGYIPLDEFIDKSCGIEERKMKNLNYKNSLNSKKK